ncbi:MAG: aminotransferase class IV [Balneolaceae bacterium]
MKKNSNSKQQIWVDGRFVGYDTPTLPPTVRGVLYGAGCFETFQSYAGRFLHLDRHLQRFSDGIQWLRGDESPVPIETDLRPVLNRLLEMNGLEDTDAIIRLQASLLAERGYRDEPGTGFQLSITATQKPVSETPVRLVYSDTCVVPNRCRPAGLKLSNTLHYLQAFREAVKQNRDDALMKTVNGKIAETSVANVFWKEGYTVYTPSPSCDILPGQMRRILLEQIPEWTGCRVEEGEFGPEHLEKAEHLWVCNSLKQVQPVASLDGREYSVESPFYAQLTDVLSCYIQRSAI